VFDVERQLETILGKKQDPGPHITAACKLCKWRVRCNGEARRKGHLSVLPDMRRPLLQRLETMQIKTVQQLARLDPVTLVGPQLKSLERAKRFVNSARARVQHRPVFTAGRLPSKADVEVFVDCETEGHHDGRDTFLWGVLICRRGGRREFVSLWAGATASPDSLFRRLNRVLMTTPQSAPIFHFGAFDRTVYKKSLRAFGDTGGLLGRFVDLRPQLSAAIALPKKSLGLRDIAASLGYRRRSSMAGHGAVLLRLEWLLTRDSATKRRLIRYNEEDVRALEFCMRELRKRVGLTARGQR
jgi:predicted RecB family nuclease